MPDTPPRATHMMTQRDVARRVGVSERTIYAWRKSGSMPPPRRVSERVLRWDADQIEAWLATK